MGECVCVGKLLICYVRISRELEPEYSLILKRKDGSLVKELSIGFVVSLN